MQLEFFVIHDDLVEEIPLALFFRSFVSAVGPFIVHPIFKIPEIFDIFRSTIHTLIIYQITKPITNSTTKSIKPIEAKSSPNL